MMIRTLALCGAFAATFGPAAAQSPEWMAEDCAVAVQSFFRDYEARTEMKYEGQRTDGTHAMNGTIYLETRSDNFQCSYDAAGTTMVDFFADGKSWPEFVRNGTSPYSGDSTSAPAAQPSSSTERVRFSAGTSSTLFPAQLPPNSTVRYLLGAKKDQFLATGVDTQGGSLQYRILNPDGSILLDPVSAGQDYRGQLWQSGDHVVEVVNRSNATVPFEIFFQIE